MHRYDERDTMFARMTYKKGSIEYDEYYSRHPEKQEIDDMLREMPELCVPGTAAYETENSPIADSNFKLLSELNRLAEGNVNPVRKPVDPILIGRKLKGLAGYFGADLAGITDMKDYHYYSYRGRQPDSYGIKIEDRLPRGLIIAVKMDKRFIGRGPMAPEIVETSAAYVRAAVVSLQIAYYIRELGYKARSHLDGNYLAIMPLAARDAGLGEIGRHGLLITPQFGPMVRLSAVTTDMPLAVDRRSDFPVDLICNVCGRCSAVCPGRAIPEGSFKIEENGNERRTIDAEKCYQFWRKVGTDCGVCLYVCPFSHGLDISGIENSGAPAQEALRLMKDYNAHYGLKPRPEELPDWV